MEKDDTVMVHDDKNNRTRMSCFTPFDERDLKRTPSYGGLESRIHSKILERKRPKYLNHRNKS